MNWVVGKASQGRRHVNWVLQNEQDFSQGDVVILGRRTIVSKGTELSEGKGCKWFWVGE